jgi:ubiquinol-cytochrome c reductase iron-sulfur subunit
VSRVSTASVAAGAVAFAAFAGAVAALVLAASPAVVGVLLALAALAGALLVADRLRLRALLVPLGAPTGDVHAQSVALATAPLTRRVVLAGAGATAAAGGALVAFGPEQPPGTGWRRGVHAVTPEGRRVRAEDLPTGAFVTVWPEGEVGAELSAVAVVRLSTGTAEPPTVLEWVVQQRIVAYSKVCTHAGCAVDLYRTGSDELYCPCHQAVFAARRGAVPVFGPAAVPLPQLPLGTDPEGYLVATGDFPRPIGPYRA